MRSFFFHTLFFGYFCALPFFTKAQPSETLLRLEPSYINQFNQEGISYSNQCFNNVFEDDQGRLWLNVCGLERLINSIGLFQFDGYRFQPVELFTTENQFLESPAINTIDRRGHFLGIAEGGQLFSTDPDTRHTRILSVDDSAYADLSIRGIATYGESVYAHGFTEERLMHLLKLEDGALVEEQSFDYSAGHWGPSHYPPLIDSSEVWLMGGTLPIYSYDIKHKRSRAYFREDFVSRHPLYLPSPREITTQNPVLLKAKDRVLFLFLPEYYGNLLFRFDREGDQFIEISDQFPGEWTPVNMFQDQVGNICFLFKDAQENYRAKLLDIEGSYFDYSGVVASQNSIVRLAGQDFRRHVFIMEKNGLYSAGIRQENAIWRALEERWISSMAVLPDGRLLVNTVNEGWFTYDESTGQSAPFQGPDCDLAQSPFAKGMKQQIIPDEQGRFWFISFNYLISYDPSTNSCQTFDLGRNAKLFAFVRKDWVAIQFGRRELSFFDLHSQQFISPGEGIPRKLNGFIRDFLVDAKGFLWVPTNDGLWRMDIDHAEYKVFGLKDGFADFRFTSIYEDAKGMLWLGTYYGGLHLYNPKTGVITIIDERKGLSNNAVMSIVPDNDGQIWVSTEYGINILSKEGEVLNSIYQEDGLAYETFERFDPLKTSDGRLFFGSRQGISIIDPGKLKATFQNEKALQIYLTEITYFDKKVGKEVILDQHLQQLNTIHISAEHPNIRLRFGLSNYLEPQKNRYAYLLEGKDKDWNYLGTLPELNISRLPPGKYRLLVKGADFRNNWTKEPITITIHAREFFYKEFWFYSLLSMPFLVFGFIWARNKQFEARRLEMEVARRTKKIREDKTLIERQAQELQQLDKLKSRFFTNISHELRTPVTLITTPLENLIRKHGASLDERISRSLQLALSNAGKLGKLVEELLELSRLEAKKATLQETPTPIHLFCRQLFNAYQPVAILKSIDYTFYSELKENAHFLIDRNRLEKIINNLIANAFKFTPSGGAIQVTVQQTKTELLIQVKDNGQGIHPVDLPHIFDRYFQTQRESVSTIGGTGIGLALSKELAQLMRGTLRVESQWGSGACFQLRLPVRETLSVEQMPEAFTIQLPPSLEKERVISPTFISSDREAAQTKLLIVEDNEDMRQLLQTLLSETYDCLIAKNGMEAWNWLETENEAVRDVELILSDIMMPEMDGYTLLEKVKNHVRWQRLPIVMLTARAAEEDKLQALRMGVDDYLLKPFSPTELQARVKNLITNYRTRKLYDEKIQQSFGTINVEFEPRESVDLVWLKELENVAKEALDKKIKLTAAYLAGRSFVSERQLSRKLKAITGLTPNEYVQEIKLRKARHLLENKIYGTVNEVARVCGYSSASYMTKLYKEHFGKMPGEYL